MNQTITLIEAVLISMLVVIAYAAVKTILEYIEEWKSEKR